MSYSDELCEDITITPEDADGLRWALRTLLDIPMTNDEWKVAGAAFAAIIRILKRSDPEGHDLGKLDVIAQVLYKQTELL